MRKNIKSRKFYSNFNLGHQTNYDFLNDPKRLPITASRYKFVGKMFEKFNNVLEIGSGDGFKSLIVGDFCNNLTLSDVNEKHMIDFKQNYSDSKIDYIIHNFEKKSLKKNFDGIFALDVLEHIKKKKENTFIRNIKKTLNPNGTLIIGMPSKESQRYASKLAKKYHVNCKTKKELSSFLKKYFNCVYMFSMNDEVLHTGYDHMSHYIIAIANSKK